MLAPISWRTPPRHYGPWELVTSLLTEALVARGVDVTLFATRDSQTAGTLAGVCPAPYSEDPSIDAKVWEMLHVAHVFERAGEFDLIHNQADFVPLAFSRLVETPVVTTIHGFSSDRILPAFKAYQDRVHYVAISDADRHPDLALCGDDPSRDQAGGLSVRSRMAAKTCSSSAASIPTREQPRRSPAARQAGRRLVMAGIIQDQGYHDAHVAPALDGRSASIISARRRSARTKALGSARALLHLVNFEEPFGLSVVEALACGTPVIASRRGSMPELIEHGVTGFLVDSVDEAVDAIGRIGEIDRAACRASVAARFTVDHMADRYWELYRSLLA
jgi:glycosyltransferase involved in cell wall biosynthesis